MRIVLTEDQIARIKLKLDKEGLNEDWFNDFISKGSDLVNKGIEAGKEFISGLDNDVEKKATDEPGKADYIGDDVNDFFEILKNIDTSIPEQKYGSMVRQQAVEAVQIGLQILGYSLPRFGTDGLFGPETAQAVNKYKKDKGLEAVNEVAIIAPLALPSGYRGNFGVQRKTHVHNGIDISASVGTPIKAIADGVVVMSDPNYNDSCGAGISIKHADGFQSGYCHLSKNSVNVGDSVKQGDIIGLTGGAAGARGAGNSDGPHLHFTLKKGGTPVNPMSYFGDSIGTFSAPTDGFLAGGSVITVEMVDKLISDLETKGVTSDDLKKHIDPAITTGGSMIFSDLDLKTSSGKAAYKDICDNYINQVNPSAFVNGTMMADSAERVFTRYGKYVPPELALAQLALEGGLLSNTSKRPIKTKNPFNVGNTDKPYRDNYRPSFEDGVDIYYDLIARKYLVKGKTANDLINDFRNAAGNHYATAGAYEEGLRTLVASIRKRNASVYARLNLNKSASGLSESLLSEADKRQAIKNAFRVSQDWADEFHRLSDKLSVWIADTFITKIVQSYGNQAPAGEDPREWILGLFNESTPSDRGIFGRIWNETYKPKYEYIMHFIRAPRREQLNVRELTLDSAYAMAEEWHDNLEVSKETNFKEEGDVFIDYRNAEGVGYYWVHLHSGYCSKEADRMGHCARSNRGELISFRKVNDFGEGESYLTVDYRPGGIIGDFHRHGNNKPTARFHKQIVDFLINTTYPVTSLTREGVHRYEDNFQLSDLSAADLKTVRDNNAALKYNISDTNSWPEIIDAILSGDLDLGNYSGKIKLQLLQKAISLNLGDEFMRLFNHDVVKSMLGATDELSNSERNFLLTNFGSQIVETMKSALDLSISENGLNVAKEHFIDSLRAISQDLFSGYQNLCPYIDYGFKKFDEEARIEIVGSRGIKRTLFSCTDVLPFLIRFAENSPVDSNGNIIVKTEDGLWGLIKRSGETILHPQFYAVGISPENKRTYTVQNANSDWFRFDPETGETLKLARKR
jgi:murein DD-endopeptidase MepM/ murein hydrolase activator NlpD